MTDSFKGHSWFSEKKKKGFVRTRKGPQLQTRLATTATDDIVFSSGDLVNDDAPTVVHHRRHRHARNRYWTVGRRQVN